MSQVTCFTSFNFNYLAKARILAQTLKRVHPDWNMHACICDREPDGYTFDIASEPFDEVTWADDLDIPGLQQWMFKHAVVELCTAVKGTMMRMLFEQGAERVIYLDPDIAVFSTLAPLLGILDQHDIVLTPHQLTPDENPQAIIDNEICSLQHGVFNLGFVAVANRKSGLAFADWWEKRLLCWCSDSVGEGLFVDQKWCDLVPCLFDNVLVLRDPGYNVASWNLSQRKITTNDAGEFLVNGRPLRFFHFTKLGEIGDTMTQRYAKDNLEVYELWSWYRRRFHSNAEPSIPPGWWAMGYFADGTAITPEHRTLFRSRHDIHVEFNDPFGYEDKCAFLKWMRQDHGQVPDA